MWRTSPLFATMQGIALPHGDIAAKKDNPDRQVWNIMGDSRVNMLTTPDVITNVQYDLPVIQRCLLKW